MPRDDPIGLDIEKTVCYAKHFKEKQIKAN